MLWEKKTAKQIRENSSQRGYLYLRVSKYKRDGRTLKRKPRHLGDGSGHKERNKYIVKKDIYLGKIIELKPSSFMSFQDYIILQLQKESDYLHYVLHTSFEEIVFDFISYLQELYEIPFSISKQDLIHSSFDEVISHQFSKKIFELKTGGFFNIVLFKRVFDFNPIHSDEISNRDFELFSNRCLDTGIFDEYIQMVLYLKLINTNSLDSVEEELVSYYLQGDSNVILKESSFEDFMRKMHKE
ncbi:MAG: hypothetical protein LAT82_02720 [Nanoarchaeota archaeon]|nr:hypothetical protein [Nanoarchaeota archaeon]